MQVERESVRLRQRVDVDVVVREEVRALERAHRRHISRVDAPPAATPRSSLGRGVLECGRRVELSGPDASSVSCERTLDALEIVHMSDVGLKEDSVALRSALEFLRRHELLESERVLVKELSGRIGDVDLESVAGEATTSSNERNGGVKSCAIASYDEYEEEEDDDEEEDEASESWKPSLLRRLQSVSISGKAMSVALSDDNDSVGGASVRSVSTILPYEIPQDTESHEEVLAHWREKAEEACEYDGAHDEGFNRYSVPRHEVDDYLVDSFALTAEPDGVFHDGNVQFSPDIKANEERMVVAEKATRVLDRGESFSFGDVPSGDAKNGVETPMPPGWVDSSRDAARNAAQVFHLKVYHKADKTGFEQSKDFKIGQGDVIVNRYRVVEGIDRAAFSKTVRAQDLQTNTPVCLKILKNNKDCVDQGLDEIKLLRLLNDQDPDDAHGIVRMSDFFYYKEHLFIVLELLRANLFEFQKYEMETAQMPYFSLARVQCIAKQVLNSLVFIHSKNLIHCDLKPENVLMKSYADCKVKIIDFGSSCFTTDVLSSYAQSRAYRAPEVIIGARYSQKVDVWSLGCILAELVSRQILFRSNSVPALLARMVSIRGPFDKKFLARGTQSHEYFTKEGFVYESEEMSGSITILRSKRTCLRARIECDDAEFIDFLETLLKVDPDARPTAAEALEHPWLSKQLS